ncbi:MAG: M55 family metallopeptidase [Lentisphaeria bacterium]|nr:M55 family metallopeptidase [Lentisphaeria bacterium]
MKIYIFADLEGISGVSGSSFVLADGANYALGKKYLTADVNACAKACFEAGADEVVVRDGHGAGNSVLWNEVDPRVRLIQGVTPGKRFYDIEGSDAVILLGYHAMAGTQNALLEHTYSSKSFQNMWLNGVRAGEFAIDTAIAGDYGIPVIMTSGCDKLCAEAKTFHPDVVTCEVKKSTSQQGAMLLSPDAAHILIEEKTQEAIAKFKAGRIKPKTVSPAVIRKEYVERMEPMQGLCDDRITEVSADTVEKAFLNL